MSESRRGTPGRPADLPSRTEAARPADNLIESARLGAERLARMSHDELRQEIARRVYMLENELKEREERRAAIEEARSEEHTSELQSLMRISYAVFCLKKKK